MHSSVYEIPTSRRVGAVVYDGSADMRLFRGPGPDRDLDRAWGGRLQRALDTERKQQGDGPLPLETVVRVHPGRLHCNFLLWAVTSPAGAGGELRAAPSPEAVQGAVTAALEFAAGRSIERIAFSALGDGAGAPEADERLATIVRAAHDYVAQRTDQGLSTGVEEVILCESNAGVIRAAERRVPDLVDRVAPVSTSAFGSGSGRKSPFASGGTKTRSPRRTTTAKPRGGAAPSRARAKKPAVPAPTLTPDEIARGRAGGAPYETRRTYVQGDVIVHSKFGVGRVVAILEKRSMQVVFEDQTVRKMVHARG